MRFRGRYYIFYNHYDSYPEDLGEKLVNTIPTDSEEYCSKTLSGKQKSGRDTKSNRLATRPQRQIDIMG